MGKGAVLLILLLYFRGKKYVLCTYYYTVRMFHLNIRQDKNNSSCTKQLKNQHTNIENTNGQTCFASGSYSVLLAFIITTKGQCFFFEIAMFINTEGLHVISFFLLAIIHDKEFSGSRFSRWYVTGRLFFSRDLTLSWVPFLSILISLYKQGINLRWISKRCVRQY